MVECGSTFVCTYVWGPSGALREPGLGFGRSCLCRESGPPAPGLTPLYRACPGAVGRAMQAILARCQRRIGGWVGSSVIHLGDHNVPNALMFIDK